MFLSSPKRQRCAGLALSVSLAALLSMPASADTSYPLKIDNCGFRVTFEHAPQKVVTIKSTAVEMLLALGLGKSIVGRGFEDGPIPAAWADAVASVPVLSEKLPSQEVVLGTEPDLVYAGWESAFTGEGAGERPALQGLGVNSYVSPAACKAAPYKPTKMTFEDLFGEIREIGTIFDAGDKAEAVIAEQKAILASIKPATPGLKALWYSSGTKTPYVGAGSGGPQMTLEALGLTNIMADIKDTWASASWEAVVDANPDVIVLVDAAWNSAEQKKKLLATNPATANLEAVKNQHYLVIPFPASEPGIRSVPATRDLADQLEKISFPR